MKNERNAGRKPIISSNELVAIKKRVSNGESVASIAREYGISRQALYNRLKTDENHSIMLEYIVNGDVITKIEVDGRKETVHIENFGDRISKYAFAINRKPDWNEFIDFLENRLLMNGDATEISCKRVLLQDSPQDSFSLCDVVSCDSNDSGLRIANEIEDGKITRFFFNKKDILYSRTDTDGYQLKALSRDRRYFVKSQASIAGILMDDWAVEIIASDLCKQLKIPCVLQNECEFVYGEQIYKGVYSKNFELDGYTFISFERLLERMGTSSKEQEFIHLDALGKMKWCARMLSNAGQVGYDQTIKYMLDLAIIDCLVGNIDRHTRNFGLFYNAYTGVYEIPLIFDSGMGLFENDGYRDRYTSYDAAMMNVYISPYGEDPFDMMELLMREFDLKKLYPKLLNIHYSNHLHTPYADIYMERMKQLCQKLDG